MLRAAKPVGEAKRAGSTQKLCAPRGDACPAAIHGNTVRQIKVFRKSSIVAAIVLLGGLSAAPTRADQGAVKPSPRGSVVIGGTSVVLIAANDRIYALVDRLEDNAPVADAALSVDLADGSSLKLSRVSDGLFVAPFNRAGHVEDAFMISLASVDGAGDGAAEIQYEDTLAPELPAVRSDLRADAAVAASVGAIGALLAGSGIMLSRTRRRRMAVPPAVSAVARS